MKIVKFISFVFIFCSVLIVNAQSVASEKFYVKLYNQAMKAFEQRDADAMAALFTEDAEQINPVGALSHGRTEIKESYIGLFKMFAQFPKPDKEVTEILDLHHKWITPEVYLTNYIDKTTRTYGDKIEIEQLAASVLLVKQKGKWFIKNLTLVPIKDFTRLTKN